MMLHPRIILLNRCPLWITYFEGPERIIIISAALSSIISLTNENFRTQFLILKRKRTQQDRGFFWKIEFGGRF